MANYERHFENVNAQYDAESVKAMDDLRGIYPLGVTRDVYGVERVVSLSLNPYMDDQSVLLDAVLETSVPVPEYENENSGVIVECDNGTNYVLTDIWNGTGEAHLNGLSDVVDKLLPEIDSYKLDAVRISNDIRYEPEDLEKLADALEDAGLQKITRDELDNALDEPLKGTALNEAVNLAEETERDRDVER